MVFYIESITDFNYAALIKGRDDKDIPTVTDYTKLPSQFYMQIKVFSQKFTIPIEIRKPGDDESSSDEKSN
jgi:hypothetical protein